MYSKFWKASLCFSAAYTLMPDTPFSPSYKTQPEPPKERKRSEREAQLARLLAESQNRIKAMSKVPERPPKERHQFFERTILESLSKIAMYHLVGFVGYLPYVSDVASYLVIPLIPFNLVADGSMFYLYQKQGKELEYDNKQWTTKDIGKIADYLSYAFAFASAGGVAKGVPGLIGMLGSMYIYTKMNKDSFDKTGAVLSGALGGTIPTVLLSQTFAFWIGKHKLIPFTLGIFGGYVAFSSLIYQFLDDYMENRNEDKITTGILSSYKWSYLYLMGLWSLFGTPSE